MSIDTFIQIVNGVGFPIAACIGMSVFIVWDRKNRTKETNTLYNTLKASLDNNTATLNKLVELMEAKQNE